MKKSEWLDCQRNEFFPKQKGIPSLVKIEHKNTATLDSARSKKKSKVAVLQLQTAQMHEALEKIFYEKFPYIIRKTWLHPMVIHECAKIIQIDPLGFDKMIFKVYPISDPTHSQLFFFNQSKLI